MTKIAILLACIIYALFPMSSEVQATSKEERLVASLTGKYGKMTIQASVIEYLFDQDNGRFYARLPYRKIDINCIENCSGFVSSEYEVNDHIEGIYRPISTGSDIVTIWEGATTLHIIVYRVDERGSKVVFDKHSRISPIISVENSKIMVEISDNTDRPGDYIHRCIWMAGINSYKLSPTNPQSCKK